MGRLNKISVDNEYGKIAIDLITKGYSYGYVQKHLEAMGLPLHISTIKNFIYKQNLDYQKCLGKASNDVLLEETVLLDSRIDIEKIFRELELSDDFSSKKAILENAEKAIVKIFFLHSAILYDRLKQYSQGACKYPREYFRNQQIIYELFNSMYGISKAANIVKAIKELSDRNLDTKTLDLEFTNYVRQNLYGLEPVETLEDLDNPDTHKF